MDEFPGLLARDFGFKPQGKSAPMAPSRSTSSGYNTRSSNNNNNTNSVFDDPDRYSDVFGGPPKYSSSSPASALGNSRSFDYDSIFRGPNNNSNNHSNNSSGGNNNNKRNVKPSSSLPVFDKPVYDDDIFDGLPGLKSSTASSVRQEDVFAPVLDSSPPSRGARQQNAAFDDLLGILGRKDPELRSERGRAEKDSPVFDDLIPGFGRSSTPRSARAPSESSQSQNPSSNSAKMASNVMDDPFVVLESTSTPETSSSGMFTDHLEEISKLGRSGKSKVDSSFVSGGVFDDIGHLDSLGKSVPSRLSENNNRGRDKNPSSTGASISGEALNSASEDSIDRFSAKTCESHSQRKVPVDNFQEPHQTQFDMPNVSIDSRRSFSSSFVNASPNETNSQVDMSPQFEQNLEAADDEWLTVSDIPLFTQPTSSPPPSRPPPPIPARVSKSRSARKKVNEFSSFPNSNRDSHSPRSTHAAAKSPVVSQMDELEEFAMGRTRNGVNNHADVVSDENVETNSTAAASAAATKEAMDRAEAKFRHAREVRGREYLKAARSRELMQDVQEGEVREKQERLDLEKDRERAHEIEREGEEREQRRLEKERERAREREQARKAVERATREARERAAAEAHIKAERAAIEKAKAEARERAERAAVQRAQAEARERAAAEAREKAEKVAAEARDRANAEARDKEAQEKAAAARVRSQRAAVERASTEARERAAAEARGRAAAEARGRAAAAARVNQQKNENDLESFFSIGSRPSSAPRPKANSSSKGGPEAARRTSVGTSSNIRKASSATNIVDDLTSIFRAAPSSGDFQEVEGESEERRKARMERHQRTQERAAKVLAEKNERDLQAQREQAERHRMGETLDIEVKRWAAGKEGNLRALLSTLQYVLWAECGWQPVSLTDLITGASVKKAYRKATLCIHPDKVQQKGATLQQKYIAEKLFDLLKEAWNKFNSEELF